jgi:hypothetical protein
MSESRNYFAVAVTLKKKKKYLRDETQLFIFDRRVAELALITFCRSNKPETLGIFGAKFYFTFY